MRRLALALGLLTALASAAFAQTPTHKRVAVLFSNVNMNFETGMGDRAATVTRVLRDAGIDYDLIAVMDTSSYGQPGMDDSTWFRQHYDAIIVPAHEQQGTPSSDYNRQGLGFRPNSARTTFQSLATNGPHNPMNGNWGIPCFAMSFSAQNTGGIGLTTGSTSRVSEGDFAALKRVVASGDSVFFYGNYGHVRDLANAFVTPIIVTANSKSIVPAAAADTMSMWLYKPSSKPGTYWLSMDNVRVPAAPNRPFAEAVLIAKMCEVTGIRPRRPFVAWYDLDHVPPHSSAGANTAANQLRDMRALFAFMRQARWVWGGPLLYSTSTENNTAGVGAIEEDMRQLVKDNGDLFWFHIHDHYDSASTGGWRGSARDTAYCRSGYNREVALAQGSAFKGVKFMPAFHSQPYTTMMGDDGDWRAAKVLGDAGYRVIRGRGSATVEIPTADYRTGQLAIRTLAPPTKFRSPGPNPVIVTIVGGNGFSITSSWRSQTDFQSAAGGSAKYYASVQRHTQYGITSWLQRNAFYAHGQQNMEGISGAPNDEAPFIRYQRHLYSFLKLCSPLIVVPGRNSSYGLANSGL